MIRKLLAGGVIAFAVAALAAAPAEAGHSDWAFGSGFHVGNVGFKIGFYGGHAHGPGFYFHLAKPLYHAGYTCSDLCYLDGDDYYHHDSCPLVGYHLGRYGRGVDYYLGLYLPAGYVYHGYGHGYRGHYGRYDRRYPDRGHAWYRYRSGHHDRHYDRRHHRGRGYGHGHYGRSDRYRHRDRGYDRRHDHRRRGDHGRFDRRDDRRRDRGHVDRDRGGRRGHGSVDRGRGDRRRRGSVDRDRGDRRRDGDRRGASRTRSRHNRSDD